jgi:glutamate formiminotransferase
LSDLVASARPCLLDQHTDADHHRTVFTMAGPVDLLEHCVRALAAAAVARLDLSTHEGVHPRIGVVDVVPWVPFAGWPLQPALVHEALGPRDRFADWATTSLELPCFLYGPERSLPELRRRAWKDLYPDTGLHRPHPTAGAAAVGARHELVAYNLWLEEPDLDLARTLATDLRGPTVRALALRVGSMVQVSCNLIEPSATGPVAVFDAVAGRTAVARAELVGLIPARLLTTIPEHRWPELDLDWSRTIEARLEEAGLDGEN